MVSQNNMMSQGAGSFFSVSHFDGKTAVRRKVDIQIIGQSFFLLEQERRHGPYTFECLNFISKKDNNISYGYEGLDGWRIILSGSIPHDLQALLPAVRTYGRWVDKLGLGPASVLFIGASAAALLVGFTAPQWLAPLIPQSVENKLGDALVGDFGGRICSTPDGDAALAKLTNNLDANSSDLQVEVVNIDMLNAVALPGGKVFLFEGLIQQAETVDEVAGVLGHEIGHVRERHVMQGLLRQLGLSLILGGLNENVGGVLNSALSNSYSRDAERDADAYSIKVLTNGNISPLGTKGFFEKLANMTDEVDENNKDNDNEDSNNKDSNNKDSNTREITSYMSSHPLSKERADAFQKSFDKNKDYKPALSQKEWGAIKSMCKNDKDVQSGFGFDLFDE